MTKGSALDRLQISIATDKYCGGGDDLDIERKEHHWWFDMGLESTKASRETINGVLITTRIKR